MISAEERLQQRMGQKDFIIAVLEVQVEQLKARIAELEAILAERVQDVSR